MFWVENKLQLEQSKVCFLSSHEATKFKRIQNVFSKNYIFWWLNPILSIHGSTTQQQQKKTSSTGGVWWWYTRHLYYNNIFVNYVTTAIVCVCVFVPFPQQQKLNNKNKMFFTKRMKSKSFFSYFGSWVLCSCLNK